MEFDFSLSPINGSTGAFIAARVDKGGCDANDAQGVYFFALADSYVVSYDLGTFFNHRKNVFFRSNYLTSVGCLIYVFGSFRFLATTFNYSFLNLAYHSLCEYLKPVFSNFWKKKILQRYCPFSIFLKNFSVT